MPTKPLIIAHRGASGYRPEHTRAAYQLAIDLGADAIEPDIVFTSDQVPVIRHDYYLSDSTDVSTRPEFQDRRRTASFLGNEQTNWFVNDFSWAEIQSLKCVERIPDVRPLNNDFAGERILRLSELVQLMVKENRNRESPLALVVEIKQATLHQQLGVDVVEKILIDLEEGGWFSAENPGTLIIESFELPILHKFRDRGVVAEYVFLVEEGTPIDELFRHSIEPDYVPRAFDDFLTEEGLTSLIGVVDGISFKKAFLLAFNDHGDLISSGMAEQAKRLGFTTYTWTLRAEAKFLERVKAGKTPLTPPDQEEDSRLWQEEFAILMEIGVDGVFTDQPDLAVQIRAALS